MENYWIKDFGNPSTIYYEGRKAKRAIENSRKTIAKIIGSKPEEIIFTNSGTESDNLAILGVINNFGKGHIITTKFEHHAVLNPCKFLESQGFKITYLDVGKEGVVNPKDVEYPTIQPWENALLKDYIYTPDNTISPPDRGVKIKYDLSTSGKIRPFTPLSFGIIYLIFLA